MARHDRMFQDVHCEVADDRPAIDALIRPGLLRAFPLPRGGDAVEEQFRCLLEALSPARLEAGARP